MTRTWWVKRLFGARPGLARRTRPAARPSLLRLEDRITPATLTEADGGTTLVIALNEANESLTVVSAGATYGFTTSAAGKFQNGGVTDPNDFSDFNKSDLTLKASGLARYDTIRILDTASNTKVTFEDSGGNAYSDQFQVTLDSGSAGIAFALASDFGAKPVVLATDGLLKIPSAATVSGTGGLTFRADDIAIDTSGTPGTVNAGGGVVTFAPFTPGNAIDLGGPDAAGVLGLTDAELDRVTAGVIRIGDAAAGSITVTAQITPANAATLSLISGGTITNSAADKGIQVVNLALRGGSVNLGTSTFNDVTSLAGTSTGAGGGFSFRDNSGALTIGTADGEIGVATSGGVIDVTATAGLLTVSSPVAAGAADINLLVTNAAGIINQSSISNSGGKTIILRADAQALQAGSAITAGGGGVVNLRANTAGVSADLGSVAAGFNFSAAELDTITAATLRVTASANINVSESITLSAAKVTALSLDATFGNITQVAGKVVSVSKLAANAKTVALTGGAHTVGTIAGSATAGDFAFLSGSSPGLTVGTVDGTAGVTASAKVTIRAVNDLTVSAAIDAGTKIELTIADGNPAGRTATVPGIHLTAPNGTTITGGDGSDTFNITASANSQISVVGGNPPPPASPGDILSIDAEFKTAKVKYQGPDLTKGTVTVGALQKISFSGIETLTVLNAPDTETELDGTAGDDLLILEKSGGVTVFSLNGSASMPVIGTKFTFNGLDGNDRMEVRFSNGGPGLVEITFNGGNDTDTLRIEGAGLNGFYRPSGADSGTVTIAGQPVKFATAERVDATAAGTFSVFFPGADDKLTIANGKDFTSNTKDALVVSSPTAAFAPIALWTNNKVAVDTADTGGLDGNDTVTITSADNAHANTNLSVRTGAGADTVTIAGPVVVSGSFAVESVAVDVNANVTAGATVTLTHTGKLQLGAVTVSGAAGVTEGGSGAVVLTGDATAKSTAGAVTFGGAIDAQAAGVQSLTVNAATGVTLSKSAGGTTHLKSLNLTGAKIALGGSVYKTELGQTYAAPVTVSGVAVELNSVTGGVAFNDTLDGAADGVSKVTVSAAGPVTFGGAVGGTKSLASLTANGTAIAVNGTLVKTSGGQTYNAPVTVGQDTKFTSTGGGNISFNDTLTGNFNVDVNTSGSTTFSKTVTVGSLTTDAGGSTTVGGNVTTSGEQTYGDGVTVTANVVFESTGGKAVAFNSTLDGGFNVTVQTAGTTIFGGKVGDAAPLASLTTDAGGTTAVNGVLVKTIGAQTYGDAVTVGAAVTAFRSTGAGGITFDKTLTSSGTVQVFTAGTTKFNGVVSVGSLVTDVGGTTQVNTPTVTASASGGLVFGDAVEVGVSVTFSSAGPVTFVDAITGAGKDVVVNTGGVTTFGGMVSVGSLKTDAGGTTQVNGVSVTTGTTQTYNDAVVIGKNTTFTSTGGKAVAFNSTLDGGFNVTVQTAGTTIFGGKVGDAAPLASLTTDAGGTTAVNGVLVKTIGAQTYGDAVTVGAAVTAFRSTGAGGITFDKTLTSSGTVQVFTAGTTKFNGVVSVGSLVTDVGGTTQVNTPTVTASASGGLVFGDAVEVGVSVTFSSAGPVTFVDAITGAGKDVVVNTGGVTTFGGMVSVGSLKTDAGGTTQVNGVSVTTGTTQTYNDAVVIGKNTTFTSTGGGDINFQSTLDGGFKVAVVTGGQTRFLGPVGGAAPLASLTTDAGGTTRVNGGLVKTTGDQIYGDAVTLGADAKFVSTAGGNIIFGATLTGGFGVEVNTTGTTKFLGAVNVAQLITDAGGATVVGGGSVTTLFGQAYGDGVTVTAATTFDGSAVGFAGPLSGAFSVTVNAAGTTFFGGPVNVSALTTDAGGATVVGGGSVTTSGNQTFNDGVSVVGANTIFTSTGGGDIAFNSTLAGGGSVQVKSAGASRFNGVVNIGSLETDAPGTTIVGTGLVEAAGGLTFRDGVMVSVPATFRAGGDATFEAALSGGVDVVILSPGTTLLGGPVSVGTLFTDAPGTTRINGGSVSTTGAQIYGDPVALGAGATFTSTAGGAVVFNQSLTGAGKPVVVNTSGETHFNGLVNVGSLATDAPGTTRITGGSIITDGSQTFYDPVAVAGAAITFTAGDQVAFAQSLSGPVPVVVNAPGLTAFGGPVVVGSLMTDSPGATIVNTVLVETTGGQDFGDPVTVGAAVTFSGTTVTFRSPLAGGHAVAFQSGGDVTFFGPVNVAALATDPGGRSVVRGGSVETVGSQSYGDAVLLGATTRLASAAADLAFGGPVDAEAAGGHGLTVTAPAGSVLFGGPVGSTGPVGFLAADAVLTRFSANVLSAGDVSLTGRGGGVEQVGGFLTAPTLGLFGAGNFVLDQLGSGLNAGNDIQGTFRANLQAGTIRLADSNDLTIDPVAGVVSGNGNVTIRTGRNFTAIDPRVGASKYSTPLVNVGDAEFVVDPGYFGPAVVTFDAEIDPARAVFGLPGGANVGGDEFRIRPSKFVPMEVHGNAPHTPLLPGVAPDRLSVLFDGAQVIGFTFDGQNGKYVFADRQPLTFTGIDSLTGRAIAGFVVQTGEPRDATGAIQVQYAVRLVQTQALQAVVDGKLVQLEGVRVLPGGLDGKALLENPFVVSPALVNPASPNAAPRIAFGDVNGDGQPDLILANGPGTAPLVTVIDGRALNVNPETNLLNRLEELQQKGLILSQFYAYDPRFLGGVNVAVADLDGDGRVEIITGAELGGGPHVRIFSGATVQPGQTPSELVRGFFVYEPTFTGGVRVAAGDVTGDGVPDLVLGAGLGGGPRVTVVDGRTLAATGERIEVANFFAYDAGFRGGIYVDAGDYDNDGFADVLTGPGIGGGSHVRVFSGRTALGGATPVELAGFFAFAQEARDNPLFTPGDPASGVGGVAFSGGTAAGSRNILVGTGRGPQVQVKEFLGNGRTPTDSVDLLLDEQFLVQAVNPETQVPNPVIFPLPTLIGYGASVGGFSDPVGG
jgi:hypothetical protein